MFILSRDGSADANPFYQVTWAVYPNLAMDLIVPRLARLMSVESATRAFHLVSQMLVLGETKSISMRPVSVDLEDSWKSEGEEGGMGWLIKSSSDDFDNHGFLEQLCRLRNICLNLQIHFYPISREWDLLQPT